MTHPKDTPAGATPAKEPVEPGSITIDLTEPVTWSGITVSSLRLPAKLRAKHLRRFAVGGSGTLDMDLVLKVAADACNVPDKVLDELAAEDAARVFEVMVGFFVKAGFLKTSPTQ